MHDNLHNHVIMNIILVIGGAATKGHKRQHHCLPGHRQREDLHRCDADQGDEGGVDGGQEGNLSRQQCGSGCPTEETGGRTDRTSG